MDAPDYWDDDLTPSELRGPLPRLLYTTKEAAAVLSIGRSKLYELLATGELESIHIGAARRILVNAVEEFIEARRAAAHDNDNDNRE